MDVFLAIGAFLVVLLFVLLILLILNAKKKKAQAVQKKKVAVIDLATLVNKIKSKTTSALELKENLELVLKFHGNIDDFSVYEKVLFAITLHPNTNKNLILYFEKELARRNPEYKKQISDAVMDALKAR